jgi:hypothetical protein
MTGVWITLGIGAFLTIADWHLATKPDPDAKIKRRKPLTLTNRRQLRDLIFGTLVAAGAVWLLAKAFA